MKYPINFEMELRRNEFPGTYIALEGIDGSGKTTQVEKLVQYFESQGKEVVTTREPRKDGLIGSLVHKVLLGEETLPSVSLQYLFSADRSANHVETVLPALKEGKVVITDRCFWSAIVYGILDRTGGEYDTSDADLILVSQGILSMYHQFTVPDYTFYLKIPVDESMKRLGGKKDAKEIYESEEKITKLYTGYEFLEKRFPEEINVINGVGPAENVTQQIIYLLEEKGL